MKKIYTVLTFLSLLTNGYSQIQVGNEIDGEAAGDQFGSSVSVTSNGGIIAVGSPYNDFSAANAGSVRVFNLSNQVWVQLGNSINGTGANDNFGSSVVLSSTGNILAIGAPNHNGSGNDLGKVQTYSLSGNTWVQTGNDILGESNNNFLGASISLSASGNIMAIGIPGFSNGTSQIGKVKVYQLNSGVWSQLGSDIIGDSNQIFSGAFTALSADGSKLAVSDFNFNQIGTVQGKIKTYQFSGGAWIPYGNTIISETSENNLRRSLSFNEQGNILAIGIPGNDQNANNSGKVQIYEYGSGNWMLHGNAITDNQAGSYFGFSVSLNEIGNFLAVGAPGQNKVSVYNYSGNNWNPIGNQITGENTGDFFGGSTALSANNQLIVGGFYNDGNGSDAGHVKVFDINSLLQIEIFQRQNFNIFPNPAIDEINIITDADLSESINIYNVSGQKTECKRKTTNQYSVEGLNPGLYFIEIPTKEGKITRKLMLKK